MKCADKIFASGEIHANLATHGAIDLREERGWHLYKINAAQIGGGCESGHIADNATTESNDERTTLDAVFGKFIVTRLYVFERLCLFPGGLANEDGYTREGVIQSVDNRLDVRSGTIRVRATLDNADGRLTPGLYARVRMSTGAPHDAMLPNEGLPWASVALGLTALGVTAAVLNFVLAEDERFPWLEILVGIGAGAVGFGAPLAVQAL